MTTAAPLCLAVTLTKVYRRGSEHVRALDNVSFDIQNGDFVAITGPSGSGKTTLLNLLGCLDTPDSGTLALAGKALHQLTESERNEVRRRQIGFVFQHFSLLPTLTVQENVELPALLAGQKSGSRARELLETVGLSHRLRHRPHELSGGEMQRAAIARALINKPALLLADEPTGNLDLAAASSIIELFHQLNRDGLTILVATHNPAMARAAHRQFVLRDGRKIEEELRSPAV